MNQEWIPLISLFVGMLVMLSGFAVWFIKWAEKRDAEQEEYFNKRVDVLIKELENVHGRIDKHVDELQNTREQMHKDFVKHTEIATLQTQIRDDFKHVFQKMGGISKALNQLIGAINGKVKDD